tara:strand:- start:969 stop:1940 length:972 start_codon:yes stop_codon:yes gene_type:complete
MSNKSIAETLKKIADLLEIKGIDWEPQAYRKAARAIEEEAGDLKEIYKKGGTKALQEIYGVGKTISKNIEYMLKNRGKSDKLQSLLKTVPKGMLDLLEVPSMGPKKIKQLYNKLGVKTLKQLEISAKRNLIQKLPGFGIKSEKEILFNIKRKKKRGEKHSLEEMIPIAKKLIVKLSKLKDVKKAEYMGSLRREQKEIGDIDLLVSSNNPNSIIKFFTTMPNVTKIVAKGKTKSSIIIKNNIQVDLRIVPPESYATAVQYFTGDKNHNIGVRKIAIKKGYKLSEWGLFDRKTGKRIPIKTERDIYKKLGLKMVHPRLRTNSGEI